VKQKLHGWKLLHLICPSVSAFLAEQKGQSHFLETKSPGYQKGRKEDQEHAALLLPPLRYWPYCTNKPLPIVLDFQRASCVHIKPSKGLRIHIGHRNEVYHTSRGALHYIRCHFGTILPRHWWHCQATIDDQIIIIFKSDNLFY
jgi:hypothetical protein